MPLTEPSSRKPFHARKIDCQGYQRDDGLWDIEAHMVDTKSYAFPNRYRGTVQTGEAVHDMWLRVTLNDRLFIQAVEAKTDAAPYPVCAQVNAAFSKLVGVRIRRGWKKQASKLLGGVKGCTHLFELLPIIATTAFQTIYSAKSKVAREEGRRESIVDTTALLINACHAYAEDGEVVRAYKAKQDL